MAYGGIRKAFSLGAFLLVLAVAAPSRSTAEPPKADVVVETSGGYARLIFTMSELSEEIDAGAQLAGNVLIVTFTKPVQVDADRIAVQAPDYFAAARRDPDGKAIRCGSLRLRARRGRSKPWCRTRSTACRRAGRRPQPSAS
jgi:hypothetical protein